MAFNMFRNLWWYHDSGAGASPGSDTSSETLDNEPAASDTSNQGLENDSVTTMVDRGTGASPMSTPPPTPTSPTSATGRKRGRPAKRLTSSKRINTKTPTKRLLSRKPLTPTTKTDMKKEQRHRLYLKRRARQAEREEILRNPETYYIVLRNKKQYRSFGGTRRK